MWRLCRKKFGHSFRWRRWAERADACSSGDNASLPILGLCHSLRPEWKHGFNFFFNGLLLAARTQLLRWLSEWDDTLLLAGSPAAMQVRRKGKRETLSDIWVSHHRQCSHFCGAEGVGSKNQSWARSAWPPLWLTWEWQDYAVLQANPFSNQLSQHHIWWKMWFGLDFHWVSALAYSTDRAGCVSHPTPTRRCIHVGPGNHVLVVLLRISGGLCARTRFESLSHMGEKKWG